MAPTRPGGLRAAGGCCGLPRRSGGCSASRNSWGRSAGTPMPESPEMAEIPLCCPRTLTALCPAQIPVMSCSPPDRVPHHRYLPCSRCPSGSHSLRLMLCGMGSQGVPWRRLPVPAPNVVGSEETSQEPSVGGVAPGHRQGDEAQLAVEAQLLPVGGTDLAKHSPRPWKGGERSGPWHQLGLGASGWDPLHKGAKPLRCPLALCACTLP